jgi:hypothetical protein
MIFLVVLSFQVWQVRKEISDKIRNMEEFLGSLLQKLEEVCWDDEEEYGDDDSYHREDEDEDEDEDEADYWKKYSDN